MHVISVTIGTSNTAQPILAKAVEPASGHPFSLLIAQNNGSNNMYIGDSAVSSTNGILMSVTGSLTTVPALQYSGDLREFYLYGTAGDVCNIMIFD